MTKQASSTQSVTPFIKNNETKKQRKGAVTAEQITNEDPFVSMDIEYLKSPSDLADVDNNPLQRIPRKNNTQSTASSTALPPQINALPLSVLPPNVAPPTNSSPSPANCSSDFGCSRHLYAGQLYQTFPYVSVSS